MKFLSLYDTQQKYIDTHNFIFIEQNTLSNHICIECKTILYHYYNETKFMPSIINLTCDQILIQNILL